jgi:hypothetical protein
LYKGEIMKALLLVLAIQVLTSAAQAVQIPGWDRPLAESGKIHFLKQKGAFEEVESLSIQLTKNDSDGTENVLLVIDNEVYDLKIQTKENVGCGSVMIKADDVQLGFSKNIQLSLADHSQRNCKDLKRFQWEVNVEWIDKESKQVLGELTFGTQPQAIYTIQSIKANSVEDKDQDLTVIRITK